MRTFQQSASPRKLGIDAILGVSEWAQNLRAQIVRVAAHDSTVLVTGPTGTGKELIARAIHTQSPRSARPFIPVDCTSISGTLFASQLFGHRKGSYTGAQYEALGCFRAADRGTIFLDEIGDLDLELQAKLLRVIQERMVIPVGSHESVPVDVRIVAATNRDLKHDVMAGLFREDLYYRLAVVPINSVPLRERSEDIPELANYFLRHLAQTAGLPLKEVSPGAMERLCEFEWPGNVRQLRHLLEQAVVACDEPLISLQQLEAILDSARLPSREEFESETGYAPPRGPWSHPFRSPQSPRTQGPMAPGSIVRLRPFDAPQAHTQPAALQRSEADNDRSSAPNLDEFIARDSSRKPRDDEWSTLIALERKHIMVTLEHTYYNQSAASRLLGITRQALIRKIKKYRIALPQSRKTAAADE